MRDWSDGGGFALTGAGTKSAITEGMAAVFALIMLPTIASVGFFLGVIGADVSFRAVFAGGVFVAIAAGILVGSLRIAAAAEH